jgi:hypothetical protein
MVAPVQPRPEVEVVAVEFHRDTLQQLDAWIAQQPEPTNRAVAIRALVTAALETMTATAA